MGGTGRPRGSRLLRHGGARGVPRHRPGRRGSHPRRRPGRDAAFWSELPGGGSTRVGAGSLRHPSGGESSSSSSRPPRPRREEPAAPRPAARGRATTRPRCSGEPRPSAPSGSTTTGATCPGPRSWTRRATSSASCPRGRVSTFGDGRGLPRRRPACPCGTGQDYAACCGPLHEGVALAESAVRLMRSRYGAYVVHDTAYLLRTWHPRTRPHDLDASTRPGVAGPDRARDRRRTRRRLGGRGGVRGPHAGGVLRERSQFSRRAGRWVYVDGTSPATEPDPNRFVCRVRPGP